jgi:hypothetical protein
MERERPSYLLCLHTSSQSEDQAFTVPKVSIPGLSHSRGETQPATKWHFLGVWDSGAQDTHEEVGGRWQIGPTAASSGDPPLGRTSSPSPFLTHTGAGREQKEEHLAG